MKTRCLCTSGIFAMMLAAASFLDAALASAQAGPELGIGYVVNAPNQFLGFSTYVLSPWAGGLGLYADAKFDLDSAREEQNFIEDLTVQTVENEIGDRFFSEDITWRSFNLALIRPFTPQLMIYAGAGLSQREVYWEYFDEFRTRGLGGFYWVEDPERRGTDINLLGGALFRISRVLSLQFGLESTPAGVTVGASYATPFFR